MADLFRVYIDDSGNVDQRTSNDPNQRYGSVSAVIMSDEYAQSRFNPAFASLTKRHFGTKPDGSPHNLHRRLLGKPPDQGPFSCLRDPIKRQAWNVQSLLMYRRAQYTLITACVDKVAWYFQYPDWKGDFYELLVQAVLERAYYYLRLRGVGEVNIEHKGPDKNVRIKEAYKRALKNGFDFIKAHQLQSTFTSVEPNIITKENCIPGMQLADLLAGPAMQHVRFINTKRHPIEDPFSRSLISILESEKFYREDKGLDGYGRIWRPKT